MGTARTRPRLLVESAAVESRLWEADSNGIMKTTFLLVASVAAAGLVAGCDTTPPGAERGPHGTIAYTVPLTASPPGARIDVNGEYVGNAPLTLKLFGDKDGTFHDFGSYYFVIRAFPLTTNQFPQVRYFRTGRFGPEDRIPKEIYFDMNQASPTLAPPDAGPPTYYAPPPYYYGPPYYYYGPYYYGPSFRFYYGPHHHW